MSATERGTGAPVLEMPARPGTESVKEVPEGLREPVERAQAHIDRAEWIQGQFDRTGEVIGEFVNDRGHQPVDIQGIIEGLSRARVAMEQQRNLAVRAAAEEFRRQPDVVDYLAITSPAVEREVRQHAEMIGRRRAS